MAILGALGGLVSRFAGRVVTSALGWAGTLLFGQLPRSRQTILAVITFGSLAWAAAIVGVIWPSVGAVLVAAIPLTERFSQDVVRAVMLALAIAEPLATGWGLAVLDDDRAPGTAGAARLAMVLRGYLVTPVLAATIGWLAAYSLVRQVRRAVRRWSELHVPLVVPEGRYDEVVEDVAAALRDAGLPVRAGSASAALALPATLLVRAAGRRSGVLVPRRVAILRGDGLEVTVHPFDAAIAGAREPVARARAAIATRLVGSPAHLTTAAESQELEDVLEQVLKAPAAASRLALADADRRLATETYDPEEWDVLARIRYQVEHERSGGVTRRGGLGPAAGPTARPGAPSGTAGVADGVVGADAVANARTHRGPNDRRSFDAAFAILAAGLTVANLALVMRAGVGRVARAAPGSRRRG